MKSPPMLLCALALLFAPACQVRVDAPDQEANQAAAAPAPQPDPRAEARARARQEVGELRFVVDRSDRELRVYRGDRVIRTHDVAVGQPDHETPLGSWSIHQVDLNPEWIPPDEEWAEDRERRAPGDPENPMGRARLIYQPTYSIHGTDALDSLGRAASHGSIRVANEVVLELAELVLKAGGAWEGDDWYREMTEDRERMHRIRLENPVPIEIVD